MKFEKFCIALAMLGACLSSALAQRDDIDASLNESVVFIPKQGELVIELETTLYKPPGSGPFPVAIINHGKSRLDARQQGRYRPAAAARYFLQRGYAVVVPMRQGFSGSGGSYIGMDCDIEGNGRVQADDVKAALDYVTAQPWADTKNIVVLGQSHGGWTTLAFGARGYPGVKALINFAGGLRQEGCPAWEQGLARGVAMYARETRLPSLWFYGDNDSFFTTTTFQAMFEEYTAAGGQARLVAFGKFGSDAHKMFSARAGVPIWQPEVSALLASVGLPSEPVRDYTTFATAGLTPIPGRTTFAPVEDVFSVPHLKDGGREGYRTYLKLAPPRAFAVSEDGAWGWAEGNEDPLKEAVAACKRHSIGPCKLYAVDDFVVWQ